MKYGEGAKVLLAGQTVLPERLLDEGYSFKFPEIDGALEDILKNEK
jgi:NAD dependent epimerase/dehydratase family enzyme